MKLIRIADITAVYLPVKTAGWLLTLLDGK